jgi:hypothetical protein
VTWKIKMGKNPERNINGCDAFIMQSGWNYHKESSARIAAKRWAERFGITILPAMCEIQE